jgi:hypothetical protein
MMAQPRSRIVFANQNKTKYVAQADGINFVIYKLRQDCGRNKQELAGSRCHAMSIAANFLDFDRGCNSIQNQLVRSTHPHLIRVREVAGSNPVVPTNYFDSLTLRAAKIGGSFFVWRAHGEDQSCGGLARRFVGQFGGARCKLSAASNSESLTRVAILAH